MGQYVGQQTRLLLHMFPLVRADLKGGGIAAAAQMPSRLVSCFASRSCSSSMPGPGYLWAHSDIRKGNGDNHTAHVQSGRLCRGW